MKVLRAIGNFFVRIGRWIRDTAWVQPLLIVGGIFAIVFSIPYITKWVQSWYVAGAEDVEYYDNFKLSLDGCDTKDSKADKLLQYLIDRNNGDATDKQIEDYGDKFFISFVQEDCASCESNYYGFEYLQKNWDKNGYDIDDNNKFGLDLSYTLTGNNPSKNGNLIPTISDYQEILSGAGTYELGIGSFDKSSNINHTYTFKIFFLETNKSQNNSQEAYFAAHRLLRLLKS